MKPKTKSYPLNPGGFTTVQMPKGAQPLALFRHSVVARVWPDAPLVDRTFLVVGIGTDLPEDVYLDFVASGSNRLLFEVRTKSQLRSLLPSEFDSLDADQIDNLFFKERLNAQ